VNSSQSDEFDAQSHPIRAPAEPTIEWMNFCVDVCPLIKCAMENSSCYSFKHIPPPSPLTKGDILETRPLKGNHQYLTMTERAYALYTDLKQHCSNLMKTS